MLIIKFIECNDEQIHGIKLMGADRRMPGCPDWTFSSEHRVDDSNPGTYSIKM